MKDQVVSLRQHGIKADAIMEETKMKGNNDMFRNTDHLYFWVNLRITKNGGWFKQVYLCRNFFSHTKNFRYQDIPFNSRHGMLGLYVDKCHLFVTLFLRYILLPVLLLI